jgi:molybdate transport system substrate-binding protein
MRGISSMATRRLLADVVQAWLQRGGAEIDIESMGGVDAARRVRDGEAYDVVVLAADAIEKLCAAGCIVPGTEADVGRSGVAIAVRQGAPRPAVDTEEALRAAVLATRSVGYSTGPSGVALQQLFARWGIAATIKARLVQAPAGVPVATLLARGDVDLGFQQLSELMHEEGVDVIGTMPAGISIITTFRGAVCSASRAPGAARAFLDFACSSDTSAIKHRHGIQPV